MNSGATFASFRRCFTTSGVTENCAAMSSRNCPASAKALKRSELIRRMGRASNIVLGEAHGRCVVCVVDDAGHRMIGLDLLALDAQELRDAPPLAGRDKIKAGGVTLLVLLGLDDEVLNLTVCVDAVGQRLDIRLGMRHFAHVLLGFLELIEGDALNVRLLIRAFHQNYSLGDKSERQARSPPRRPSPPNCPKPLTVGPE